MMMLAAVCLLVLVSLVEVKAQNGVCSSAIDVGSLPVQANGNTMDAELHLDGAAQVCRLVSGPRRSSWFSFTAESDGCVTARAKGVDIPESDEDDGFETAIGIFAGDCETLTCEAMNDDESVFSTDSVTRFTVQSNTTYFVMVTGWNPEVRGAFEMTLEQSDSVCGDQTGSQYCNVCPDGGIPGAAALFNPGKRILCSEAAETFGVIEGTDLCDTLQMMGSAVCSCEHSADSQVESCKLCPGGEDVPDPLIPVNSIGETCGIVSDLKGEVSCRELTRRGLATQCKCPGTQRCDLCGGTGGSLISGIEITRGDTCADAQRLLEDLYTAYPSFLGCEPGVVDFHYQANVREACCQGASLSVVEADERTIPPTSSPLGSNGNNVGNGVVNTLQNIGTTIASTSTDGQDGTDENGDGNTDLNTAGNSAGIYFAASAMFVSIGLSLAGAFLQSFN